MLGAADSSPIAEGITYRRGQQKLDWSNDGAMARPRRHLGRHPGSQSHDTRAPSERLLLCFKSSRVESRVTASHGESSCSVAPAAGTRPRCDSGATPRDGRAARGEARPVLSGCGRGTADSVTQRNTRTATGHSPPTGFRLDTEHPRRLIRQAVSVALNGTVSSRTECPVRSAGVHHCTRPRTRESGSLTGGM